MVALRAARKKFLNRENTTNLLFLSGIISFLDLFHNGTNSLKKILEIKGKKIHVTVSRLIALVMQINDK